MFRRFLLACALLVPVTAVAAPRSSSLSWVRLDGAESCLAAPDLARAVEARLGRTVFVTPATADLAVEGRVEPLGAGAVGWRAVLKLTDAAGKPLGDRTVESHAAACDELGRTVAVTLALMIEPPGTPAEPPVATPPAPPPPPPPPPPDNPRRWQVGIDGSLTGGAGAVPGVGIGGITVVRVRPPGFIPLVAQGELVPFSRVGDEAAHTDFTRLVGGVQGCPLALTRANVTLDGCLGVDAGVIFVLETTAAVDATEKVVVQAHGALHLRWNVVGPLVLRAGLHPIVPLRSVSFVDSAGEVVYTPAPVAGFVDVGLGLAL